MKTVAFIVAFCVAAFAFGAVTYLKQIERSPLAKSEEFVDSLPKPVESGPAPKIVVADPGPRFKFEEMVFGDSMDHTFVIRNEGEGPLELEEIAVGCKCTLGEISESSVPPGGETEVVLTWKPTSPGEFAQGATIATNDPEMNPLVLNVSGPVVTDVSVIPSDVWSFGTISEDVENPSTLTGLVISQADYDFEVLEVIADNPAITAEIEPMDSAEDLEQAEARAGAAVSITVAPDVPVGRFAFPVTIKTSSERQPEVKITVGGTRSGPFTVLGRGWIGANARLDLKRFQADEGTERDLLMIVEKFDEPLELTVDSVIPDLVTISFERDASYEHPTLEKYKMTVAVPPGVKSGSYEAPEDRVSVQMTSNHPKFSSFAFEVAFRAE